MKLSKNLILLIIVVLLGLSAWAYSGPIKTWNEQRGEPKNPLTGLRSANLKTIEIKRNKLTTKLVKAGELWLVDDGTKYKFPVMKSLTDLIETRIASATQASIQLVSTNPGKQADFQVAGDKAIGAKFSTNDKDYSLTLGKMTADYQSTYIALPGSTNTYKLEGVLSAIFDRDDWRDLAIFSTDQATIDYLRLQGPTNQVVLNKKDNNWLDGKVKYKATEVDKIISVLASLQAVKIPTQDYKSAGLEKPERILEIKGAGFDNTLIIGKSTKDKNYYVKTGASDNLYLISKTDHDALIATPSITK
jgi:hypothetical protein